VGQIEKEENNTREDFATGEANNPADGQENVGKSFKMSSQVKVLNANQTKHSGKTDGHDIAFRRWMLARDSVVFHGRESQKRCSLIKEGGTK